MLLPTSQDDTISVKYKHKPGGWEGDSHGALHTVYLLVRIISLITLSEAAGAQEPPCLFRHAESRAFEVSLGDATLISFLLIKLLETCPKVDGGGERSTATALARQRRQAFDLGVERQRQPCTRCYCPLGEQPGMITPRSSRWLLQPQHEKNTLFYPREKLRRKSVPPRLFIIAVLIGSAAERWRRGEKNYSLCNPGASVGMSKNKQRFCGQDITDFFREIFSLTGPKMPRQNILVLFYISLKNKNDTHTLQIWGEQCNFPCEHL